MKLVTSFNSPCQVVFLLVASYNYEGVIPVHFFHTCSTACSSVNEEFKGQNDSLIFSQLPKILIYSIATP